MYRCVVSTMVSPNPRVSQTPQPEKASMALYLQSGIDFLNQDVGTLMNYLGECLEKPTTLPETQSPAADIAFYIEQCYACRQKSSVHSKHLFKEAQLNKQIALDCQEEIENLDEYIAEQRLAMDSRGWGSADYKELERLYSVRAALQTESTTSKSLADAFKGLAKEYSSLIFDLQRSLSDFQRCHASELPQVKIVWHHLAQQYKCLEEKTTRLNQQYLGTMDPEAPLLHNTAMQVKRMVKSVRS